MAEVEGRGRKVKEGEVSNKDFHYERGLWQVV